MRPETGKCKYFVKAAKQVKQCKPENDAKAKKETIEVRAQYKQARRHKLVQRQVEKENQGPSRPLNRFRIGADWCKLEKGRVRFRHKRLREGDEIAPREIELHEGPPSSRLAR